MKEISNWVLGLTLTGWSFMYQFKAWVLEQDVNMGMSVTLFILAVVWWIYRIKKERKDFKNSDSINRTLMMDEEAARTRLQRFHDAHKINPLKKDLKDKKENPNDANK